MFHTPQAAPWLVATDVDGTLVDATCRPTPRVRAALTAARDAGHHVTLATGRAHRATVAIADDLGIREPLICHQGALIQQGEQLLAHWQLSLGLSQELIAFAEAEGLHANFYLRDRLLVLRDRAEMASYTALVPMIETRVVPDLATTLHEGLTKVVFVLRDEERTTCVLKEASYRWSARAQVVRSHALFVEVTSPLASKGNAVMALAERLGVPRGRVLAIGDNLNDLSMIRAAGIGVAMGDAEVLVRESADWVAPPLAQDGLAAAIRRFLPL